MSTYKLNKSVNFKIAAPDETLSGLDNIFMIGFEAFRIIYNELPYMGGKEFHIKEENAPRLTRNITDEHSRKKNDRLISTDDIDSYWKRIHKSLKGEKIEYDLFRECLSFLYKSVINLPPTAFASTFFGTPNDESRLKESDKKYLKSLHKETGEKSKFTVAAHGNISSGIHFRVYWSLKDAGFFDREGYNNSIFDQYNKIKYVVADNLNIKSWNTWCGLSKNAHDELDATYSQYTSKLTQKQLKGLEDFWNYCRDNNLIRNVNESFISYMSDCLLPILVAGEEYKESQGFCMRKGEKKKYSIDIKFFEYLRDHKELWSDPERPLCVTYINCMDVFNQLDRTKPYANFPMVGPTDYHRFKMQVDPINFLQVQFKPDYVSDKAEVIKVQRKSSDENKKIIMVEENVSFREVNKINAQLYVSGGPKLTDNHFRGDFQICLNNHYKYSDGNKIVHGATTKGYFGKMMFGQSAPVKGDEHKRVNYVKFTKHGQEVMVDWSTGYIVKQQYNGKSQLEFRVNLRHTNDYDEVCKMNVTLSSAWKPTGTAKSNAVEVPKKAVTIMGIDIGMRNPFAYAIGTAKFDKKAFAVPTITKSGVFSQDEQTKKVYTSLLEDMKGLTSIIAYTKNVFKNKGEENDFIFSDSMKKVVVNAQSHLKEVLNNDDHKRSKVNIQSMGRINRHKPVPKGTPPILSVFNRKVLEQFTKTSVDSLVSNLKSQVSNLQNIADIKTDSTWVANIIYRYIKDMIGSIRSNRKFFLSGNQSSGLEKQMSDINWYQCLEYFKRVKRSLSYIGTDNSRTPIVTTELNEYMTNVKSNLLKQIAAAICRVATENKVQMVVIEDFSHASKKKTSHGKYQNWLLAMFSPKDLSDAISNALSWHGMCGKGKDGVFVAGVSESCTSQVVYGQGVFGYRDKDRLYYLDDSGKLQFVHSDENAAKNILHRACVRHTDINSLYFTPEDQKVIEVNSGEEGAVEKDKVGKRTRGMLEYHYGSVKKGLDTIRKEVGFSKKDSGYVYKHGGKWITQDQRDSIVDGIEAMVNSKKTMKA